MTLLMATLACLMSWMVHVLEKLSCICGISPHRTRGQWSLRSQPGRPECVSGHGHLALQLLPQRRPRPGLWPPRLRHVLSLIRLLGELCEWGDGPGSFTAIHWVAQALCAFQRTLARSTSTTEHIVDVRA